MSAARTLFAVAAVAVAACATAPKTPQQRATLVTEADEAMKTMVSVDPTLGRFVRISYGHIIFPSVGEGGFVVGAAYGRGVVYAQNAMTGYADLKVASVGAEAGGQTFDELVVFADKAAYDRMINSGLTFRAEATATLLTKGAAAATQFENGVAVFTHPIGGLMAGLSIGGQSISFVPAEQFEQTTSR